MEKEQRIQLLQDIVKIKLVNANEKEVANYLADLFARCDIETQQMVATESLVQLVKKNYPSIKRICMC
ncbi:MAG: hypothetical protein ABS895_06205 [Aerococcus urinaeequi]